YQQVAKPEVTCGVFDAMAPVGPDAFGYYAIDSADIEYPNLLPEYSWTELNPTFGGSGTEVVFVADNDTAFVDLDFQFNYYGQDFDEVRICDNGWISFGHNTDFDFYNWPIPSPHGADGVIAPFWDNFDPIETAENGGGVFYSRSADEFIVEWSRMVHYRPEIDDLQTFQVILNSDGDIRFMYRQVQDVDFARTYSTVGIESPDETDGLQLSYSNIRCDGTAPIGSGLAILLTTEIPVYQPYELGSYGLAVNGGSCDISWETADNRPVTGWLISRIENGSIIQLTDSPLPATACQFVDNEFNDGAQYGIIALHPFGGRTEFGPYEVDNMSGVEFFTTELLPCQPNPSQGNTSIAFNLGRSGMATLEIYDVAGRLVRTLLKGEKPEGPSSVIWDGCNDTGHRLGAGTYFYRLQTKSGETTRKMLLVR
ncbi:T9SS type A sorting domain-containing protein, partial [bacterium]|nr:T9SS type A sorting domain-containing protein [bacterium]